MGEEKENLPISSAWQFSAWKTLVPDVGTGAVAMQSLNTDGSSHKPSYHLHKQLFTWQFECQQGVQSPVQ